jgi:hypothetical protein
MKTANQILDTIKRNTEKAKQLEAIVKETPYSKRTEPEIVKAANDEQILRIANKFLYDNARLALYADVMPIVLDVFRAYSGKAYGEKTKAKINDEIKARANCHVYIEQTSYSCYINVVPLNKDGYSDYTWNYKDFNVSARWTEGKNTPILIDNKINPDALNLDNWYLTDCGEYTENATKAARDLMKKFEAVNKAWDSLVSTCGEFNKICPSGVDRCDYYNFKNYLSIR